MAALACIQKQLTSIQETQSELIETQKFCSKKWILHVSYTPLYRERWTSLGASNRASSPKDFHNSDIRCLLCFNLHVDSQTVDVDTWQMIHGALCANCAVAVLRGAVGVSEASLFENCASLLF